MQLNFLQEELLEILQQDKAAPTTYALQQTHKHTKSPIQTSLLEPEEISPVAVKKTGGNEAHAAPEEKAEAAFKTISEAADILAVPAYVLRFWESQFSQIKPTKSRGGRRYYRPEDMEVLARIKHLLYHEGYTIKGARKAFGQAKRSAAPRSAELVPVAVKSSAHATKPVITAKQKAQLSAIRSELLDLRDELAEHLNA